MVGNVYFKIYGHGLLSVVEMTTSFDISQELFSIDILTALKYSLKHRRKHVLRRPGDYMETRLKGQRV